MESQKNPIPAKIRGRILVVAIVAGAATGPITLGMAAGGIGSDWIAVAAGALSAIPVVAASLSRANLTLDKSDDAKP